MKGTVGQISLHIRSAFELTTEKLHVIDQALQFVVRTGLVQYAMQNWKI